MFTIRRERDNFPFFVYLRIYRTAVINKSFRAQVAARKHEIIIAETKILVRFVVVTCEAKPGSAADAEVTALASQLGIMPSSLFVLPLVRGYAMKSTHTSRVGFEPSPYILLPSRVV